MEPETYGEQEITCPHCGYEHGDSWEIREEDGIDTCENRECKKKFKWQRVVDVTYDTQALDTAENSPQGENKSNVN